MADFSFSNDPELHHLKAQVDEDPDSYEHWEALVTAAQNQEGGLHRNSTPEALAACRQTFDAFLARFPLFFGFWKRYAEFEFSIAGSEAAELVYERGVASVPYSVDMWECFCVFKMDTCHNPEVTRELFERGAETIGLHYHAHPFWDKYIEFESREGHRSLELLRHIVTIPLMQYSRFWEQYRSTAGRIPVEMLVDEQTLYDFHVEADQQLGGVKNPQIFQQALRKKADAYITSGYAAAEKAVTDRWVYEQKIHPSFYTVAKLEDEQLQNWRDYLTFEESQWNTSDSSKFEDSEQNYARTKLLYERCLIPAANYEEFWFRYIRWLMACGDKTEEIRSAYQRASFIFIEIAKPAIRLAWAKYEEAQDRPDVALEIHEAILLQLPNDFETYRSMCHVVRRNNGFSAAEDKIKALLSNELISPETRGAILTEWARFKWQIEGSYSTSLELFPQYHAQLAKAQTYWSGWLVFESERPQTSNDIDVSRQVRRVHMLAQCSDLSIEALKSLASQYMAFLDTRGSAEAMKESVLLDAYINGPELNRNSKVFESLFSDAQANGIRPKLTLTHAAA